MKLFVVFSIFLVAIYGLPFSGLNRLPETSPSDKPPCNADASNAYLDILLMIDTSSNMGSSNLKKISTTMALISSKFTIGQQTDYSTTKNTRVAVITYADQATITANFTNINSANDLVNVLNGISVSNTKQANLTDAFVKAYTVIANCTLPDDDFCPPFAYPLRPVATILFAATSNGVDLDGVDHFINVEAAFEYQTIITVNFNSADQTLTKILNNMTYNYQVNASMYNYQSSSGSLTQNLQWALLQVNCFCRDADNFVYFDTTINQYSKVAQCLGLAVFLYDDENGIEDMCTVNDIAVQSVPAFILSTEKQKFIESSYIGKIVWPNPEQSEPIYPAYFGLHKNSQGQWMFYNYNGSDFVPSNFINWGPGYPDPSHSCAVLNSHDNMTYVWESVGCEPSGTGDLLAICQAPACDTSSLACCSYCNGGLFEDKETLRSKMRKRRELKRLNHGMSIRVNK
uniref:VWFA domain-containing protein n=1 Tax=Acrobeloides nanus TaxID=290746 RepID=A0A914CYB5_9BILA